MNPHDYLIRVRHLDELIKAKCAERDQLMVLATSVSANMDGMPHASGKSDKVGNIAVKLADLENEINEMIDRYVNLKRDVVTKLEALPHQEYLVLHKYYIQGMTLAAIANDMYYHRVTVSKIKARAMERLKQTT